eukprot:CAMPEP_0114168376 /NCGR_PEP_ID=MMETSP0043_2-20121206/32956_1 /TAXON_ID=464988 /ORGANISM="Hemiselmis andersenii, Strain CCMP644" /LENGTH=74 /DNA_ID=CAMNT_0001265675 /DNA_START=1 /DNA_END=228 /DNA_ORIENTATION=+
MGFIGVNDDGVPGLEERQGKEQGSLAGVRKMAGDERLATMGALHMWLYSQHNAYATGGKVERIKGKKAKATYGG